MTPLFMVPNKWHDSLKTRYKQRRLAFMEQLDAPAIIIGLKQFPEEKLTPWDLLSRRLKQIPLIIHLTGFNEKNIALFMDPKSKKSYLFVDRFNPKTSLWDGQNLYYQNQEQAKELAQNYGFDHIKAMKTLPSFLIQYHKKNAFQSLYSLWYKQANNRPVQDICYRQTQNLARLFKRHQIKLNLMSLEHKEWQLRLPFDACDINIAKKTQALTKDCFVNTLKHIKHCHNERQVAGFLNGQIEQASSLANSFPSIVAGGKNACVLHYHDNHAALNQADLLLLDFGLRYADLVSDISRTVPISGRFNPLQKLVYQQVLAAQNFVQQNIKPGAILKQINQACWTYLHDNLKKSLSVYQGGFETAYDTAPHFVSHFMKTAVHDGDYQRQYQQRGLRVGECLSNEPGFYGQVYATINGKTYQETMGIRIEDNLLVTENGCHNLSQDIPKTCDEIEQLMAL